VHVFVSLSTAHWHVTLAVRRRVVVSVTAIGSVSGNSPKISGPDRRREIERYRIEIDNSDDGNALEHQYMLAVQIT